MSSSKYASCRPLLCVSAFVVRAQVLNCLNKRGVRARIYNEAQQRQAYYSTAGREDAFRYDGDDLHLNLGFESKERANDMQTWLLNANMGTLPLVSLTGQVTGITVERAAAPLFDRVLLSQYQATNSTSPADTVQDIAEDSSVSESAHSIALDTLLVKYQSIERADNLTSSGIDVAHIVPRTKCKSLRVTDDDNNHLALTKAVHSAYDGPHSAAPTIAIRPARPHEVPATPACKPSGRDIVFIVVEGIDQQRQVWISRQLREDYVQLTNDQNEVMAFMLPVYVLSAAAFNSNLQKRCDMTSTVWEPLLGGR